MGTDTRIVYGARCAWWDSIDKAGSSPSGLPGCPHCAGVLMEVESEEKWWEGANQHDVDHPGYVEFLTWSRGQCFPTFEAALAVYTKQTGKTVAL